MNKFHNSKLKNNSQNLRKQMTKEERYLWYAFLKTLPVTINCQKIIGSYILDFYCASAHIAIELDGSQHYTDEGQKGDESRDAFLAEHGIKVLRYSNADINQRFEVVCEDIWNHIFKQNRGTPHPSPSAPPSPQGEGKGD